MPAEVSRNHFRGYFEAFVILCFADPKDFFLEQVNYGEIPVSRTPARSPGRTLLKTQS